MWPIISPTEHAGTKSEDSKSFLPIPPNDYITRYLVLFTILLPAIPKIFYLMLGFCNLVLVNFSYDCATSCNNIHISLIIQGESAKNRQDQQIEPDLTHSEAQTLWHASSSDLLPG